MKKCDEKKKNTYMHPWDELILVIQSLAESRHDSFFSKK